MMIQSGQNSFAEKMKVIIMILLSLCAGANACCQPLKGNARTGVSITAAAFRHTLGIEVGYAFSKHWSAEGCVWESLPYKEGLSQEESIHNALLGNTAGSAIGQSADGFSMELRYWPAEAFSGPYISTGCTYEEPGRTDGSLGAGYMMKIWKGLFLSLSFKTGIKELMTGEAKPAESIDIGINYIF